MNSSTSVLIKEEEGNKVISELASCSEERDNNLQFFYFSL